MKRKGKTQGKNDVDKIFMVQIKNLQYRVNYNHDEGI